MFDATFVRWCILDVELNGGRVGLGNLAWFNAMVCKTVTSRHLANLFFIVQ